MGRKMKDSGVEWIGEIPKEWSLRPFRYVLKERQEKNSPVKSKERLSLSIDLGVTLYAEKTTNLDRFKDDFEQYKLAYPGDLVMNSMNMIVGASGVSDYFGCVSPVYYTFYDETKNHVTAKYCEYIFRSRTMLRVLFSMGKGIYAITRGDDRVNTCRLKVSKEDLKSLKIPFPSLVEQNEIVSFLQRKCNDIENVIKKTNNSIESYKSLKQVLITHAVTKGVRGKREMKDSGIDWLGEIPVEWQYKRLRFIGNCQNGISKSAQFFGKGFPFVSYSDVYKNMELSSNVEGLVQSTEDEQKIYSVKRGDILFTRTSETIEEVGFSSVCMEDIPNSTFAGFVIRVRPYSNELVPSFSKYYFRSNIHRRFLVKEMNLVTRASLGQNLLKNMIVLLPAIEEQKEIAAYLDEKCTAIDNLIAKKEQLLTELEAYKKSLIYEYVTGKREVLA